MDKRVLSILGVVLLLGLVVAGAYYYQQQNTNEDDSVDSNTNTSQNEAPINGDEKEPVTDTTSYQSEKGVAITVTQPVRTSKVTSPLKVSGSVPGSWSFEGQFAVRLLDTQSNVIAEAPAKLDGDWMTESPVPFTSTLTFDKQEPGMGLLVLVRSNPSDLAENSDSLTIPIEF